MDLQAIAGAYFIVFLVNVVFIFNVIK